MAQKNITSTNARYGLIVVHEMPVPLAVPALEESILLVA
jgi:hypothetical protein